MARRTLQDLYVKGKEVAIGEGDDTVKVWVQKMNPVEHSEAIRHADAARARVLACKFDAEGEQYQAVLDDILVLDRDTLVEVLCIAEEARILPARQAKVASEDVWNENNYLDGLRDLWDDEMFQRFVEDPEDTEAKRVNEELDRYLTEVRTVVDHEIESFRISLGNMSERELVDTAMEMQIKNAGDSAWLKEYHRSEIAVGTRKATNHRERVFQHRAEVDEVQEEVYLALGTAFRELNVDPTEGKDSAVVPPSSPSSEQSEQAETAQPSGPETAAA